MQIDDWFLGLFTVANLAYFVFGATVTCLYHLIRARLSRRIVIIKWQYLAVPLAVGIVFNIALQNQQNADCVREFNQALRVQSALSQENDRLSIAQRELIYDWMHALVFPPPEIAALPTSDPRREQYGMELTIATDKRFAASIAQQRINDRKRAENPLPEPTCGLR